MIIQMVKWLFEELSRWCVCVYPVLVFSVLVLVFLFNIIRHLGVFFRFKRVSHTAI